VPEADITIPPANCVLPREKQYVAMDSISLAILVIDENRIRASIIEAGLRETGHDNVTVVDDITGVTRAIAAINPDVIVISLEDPNRDVLENMLQLSRAVKRPITSAKCQLPTLGDTQEAILRKRAASCTRQACLAAFIYTSMDGQEHTRCRSP